MLRHLITRIKANGPLTVAEYMREVLTNPRFGYYMSRDVFGSRGDFTTSPEISQVFGEIFGVWCIRHWQNTKEQTPVNLIEFGPGRGTLMSDILRTANHLKGIHGHLRAHLIEVSPYMRQLQYQLLCGKPVNKVHQQTVSNLYGNTERENVIPDDEESFRSHLGFPVTWHSHLSTVPAGFSLIIAHEFLDALPVHQFQRTPKGWREVLVDTDPSQDIDALRFVLAPNATPAVAYLQGRSIAEDINYTEVCPAAGMVTLDIANRVAEHSGGALLVDYGEKEPSKKHSLRAFRDHKLHDVLSEPGTADITADVDFGYLKTAIGDQLACYGPIPQGYFLTAMGIQLRIKMLLRSASKDQARALMSGFEYLCSPKRMGLRFKVLALSPNSSPAPPPFQKANHSTSSSQ